MLRVGSTFSGVGGADLGLERAGFELAWTCEWDEWKRGVLAAHWPGVPHYSDVRDLADAVAGLRRLQPCSDGGRELHDAEGSAGDAGVAPVDLLVGGFPCQDLSVAGKRRGFDGERSVLAFEFLRIAESLRPRWLLMENVPGLLSSNGGRDLARLLDELGACGYGWAYRILDARYFGVPQRRRRVFICARRTDSELDSGAAAGLALRALWEGSGGDPTPGWPPRQDATASTGGSAQGGRIVGALSAQGYQRYTDQELVGQGQLVTHEDVPDVAGTITRRHHKGTNSTVDDGALISFYPTGGSQNGFAREDGVSPTLKRGSTIGAESGTAIAYRKSKRAASDQDDETWVADGAANTLNAFDAGDTRTTHAVVDVASTLQSAGGERGQRIDAEGAAGGHLVPVSQAYSIREDNATNTFSATPIDAARCLQKHQPSINSHHAQNIITQTFPIDDGRPIEKHQNGTGIGDAGAPAYTLDRQQRPAVAQVAPTLTRHNLDSRSPQSEEQQRIVGAVYDAQAFTQNQREEIRDLGDQSGALTGQGTHQQTYLREQMSVRRLTPVECERLMGWPDNWTAPPGVKAPDSKRYAACGDGIVSWVAYWIGCRIQMIEAEGDGDTP